MSSRKGQDGGGDARIVERLGLVEEHQLLLRISGVGRGELAEVLDHGGDVAVRGEVSRRSRIAQELA